MIISKQNRRAIYENLFKEGVLVAKKDYNAPKHEDLDVPNLEVIKAMQSLTSRGFVKTQFSWQYYYYTLTNEGLDYLREWLHLPAEIVPETHRKPARQPKPAAVRPGGEGAYRPPRGDRDDYRRRDDGAKKEEGAGADFRPRFSGVGRGLMYDYMPMLVNVLFLFVHMKSWITSGLLRNESLSFGEFRVDPNLS
ncbi:40S ribosomal protein S10 [Rhizoctonia solani AG-1 IB]|uniref:40S ribosomal protein S10 n=1 Tax=Thanatephorus cucumeris (strain AG1-IB / isolate 7/3/14) TaxID=1108050 RepID=M5BSY2_THACB|nr:40S ribosomal protein S10 [Rhizoctonia solani AG-1 IB]